MRYALRAGESGNVLVYILIAVALIASLSYAVSQSSRGSSQQVSEERARLLATEILEYAGVLGNAVAQLRLRGCDADAVSFEGGPTGSYVNGNAPSDNTCHVFHISGGGVTHRDVPPGANGTWIVSADMGIEDIGTSGAADANMDLAVYIQGLKESVCIQLNTLSGVSVPATIPGQANSNFATFQGNYVSVNHYRIGVTASGTDKLSGMSAGCFQSPASGGDFIFYKVLLAR